MLLRIPENSTRLLAPLAVSMVGVMAMALGVSAQTAKAVKSPQAPQAAPSAKEAPRFYKGILIRQTALNQGSLTIYLCPKRWILKTSFVTIIVDEENDRVIAYTRQTNKYLLDTVKVGMTRFNGFRRGGDFEWGPFTVIEHRKWQNKPVVTLERKGKRKDLKIKNDVVITERQVSCTSFPGTKVFQEIAYALFDTEYRYGLPIHVSRMAHSANPRYCTLHPVVTLDTVSVSESTFPASEFDVPRGLTRVKSEIDLFSNDMEGSGFASTPDYVRNREKQLRLKTPH